MIPVEHLKLAYEMAEMMDNMIYRISSSVTNAANSITGLQFLSVPIEFFALIKVIICFTHKITNSSINIFYVLILKSYHVYVSRNLNDDQQV